MKKFALAAIIGLVPFAAVAEGAAPVGGGQAPTEQATGFLPLLGAGGLLTGAVGVGVLGAIANGGGGQPADTTTN